MCLAAVGGMSPTDHLKRSKRHVQGIQDGFWY